MKSLSSIFATGRSRAAGKIYISGTGRAGTTFLVQLLTRLGEDTGFKSGKATKAYFPTARAGLEKDIFDKRGPRIIKSPFLCDRVDDVLAAGIMIDHVVIPVRNFSDAADSRRHVQMKTTGAQDGRGVAGGLWDTEKADLQEHVLGLKFGRLVEALVRNEIGMTFLSFPRFTRDPDYLYEQIGFLLPGIEREAFIDAFAEEVRPELVGGWQASAGVPNPESGSSGEQR
jgi:hypothetical protein